MDAGASGFRTSGIDSATAFLDVLNAPIPIYDECGAIGESAVRDEHAIKQTGQ